MAKDEPIPDEVDDFDDLGTTQEVSGARPSTDANIVFQLLAGLLGTAAVAFAVLPLKKTGIAGLLYINGVINERGPVQYAELFMAFMVATMVFLKTKIVRQQLGAIATAPVPPDIDLTDDEQISNLRRDLSRDDASTWSIVINRVDRLLALWLGSKDISRVSDWAQAESARDTSASDSTYSNARVLIWAIPIMGFIGTVLGLGAAVAGFSDFLSDESAGLNEIKGAIGNVTQGLGTAFDTTLLALILSVFLMFPLASVQRREENLFVEVDNYLDDTLTSRLPSAEQQPIVIENLEDSIEAAFRRYIPDPDRYDEVFTRSIERAAASVEERFSGLTQNYEATLRDLTGRLSENLVAVGNSMEEALRNAVSDLREQDEQLVKTRKEIAADEGNRLKAMFEEVQAVAMKTSLDYQEKASALQATTQEGMEKTMSAAQNISGRMEEVGKLASNIEDLLRVQEAVEKAIQGLSASEDFRTTLADIRRHLATTDAFCDRIGQPRVITLEEELV